MIFICLPIFFQIEHVSSFFPSQGGDVVLFPFLPQYKMVLFGCLVDLLSSKWNVLTILIKMNLCYSFFINAIFRYLLPHVEKTKDKSFCKKSLVSFFGQDPSGFIFIFFDCSQKMIHPIILSVFPLCQRSSLVGNHDLAWGDLVVCIVSSMFLF